MTEHQSSTRWGNWHEVDGRRLFRQQPNASYLPYLRSLVRNMPSAGVNAARV